jgi:large subunit ribosomal protein L24e
MVVKRTCSFCAGEIEPGTGMMFIKRDGTVFHFCTSSCRKQQLHLGRVGHRLKWTRAHALRRQTEQSSAAGKLAAEKARAASAAAPAKVSTKPKDSSLTPGPASEEPAAPATSEGPTSKAGETATDAPAPAKKPRAKKPKASTDSS